MRNIFKVFLFSICVSIFSVSTFAQECFPKKNNSHLVYDQSNLLSASEEQSLDAKLTQFSLNSSNQIVVVIVDDLCGMDPAMYSTELGQKWGVGQAKEDNGIVILVKPTGGAGQRKTHISIGYGLEGVIPDAIAKRIVNNELLPNFKQGQFYNGLNQATGVLMALAIQEYDYQTYQKQSGGEKPVGAILFLVFLMVFFVIFLNYKRINTYAKTNNLGFWAALLLLNESSRSHRGSWNSFHGGSGGFGGGSSGGGFGGFGGGGFGGGGAGGSW